MQARALLTDEQLSKLKAALSEEERQELQALEDFLNNPEKKNYHKLSLKYHSDRICIDLTNSNSKKPTPLAVDVLEPLIKKAELVNIEIIKIINASFTEYKKENELKNTLNNLLQLKNPTDSELFNRRNVREQLEKLTKTRSATTENNIKKIADLFYELKKGEPFQRPTTVASSTPSFTQSPYTSFSSSSSRPNPFYAESNYAQSAQEAEFLQNISAFVNMINSHAKTTVLTLKKENRGLGLEISSEYIDYFIGLLAQNRIAVTRENNTLLFTTVDAKTQFSENIGLLFTDFECHVTDRARAKQPNSHSSSSSNPSRSNPYNDENEILIDKIKGLVDRVNRAAKREILTFRIDGFNSPRIKVIGKDEYKKLCEFFKKYNINPHLLNYQQEISFSYDSRKYFIKNYATLRDDYIRWIESNQAREKEEAGNFYRSSSSSSSSTHTHNASSAKGKFNRKLSQFITKINISTNTVGPNKRPALELSSENGMDTISILVNEDHINISQLANSFAHFGQEVTVDREHHTLSFSTNELSQNELLIYLDLVHSEFIRRRQKDYDRFCTNAQNFVSAANKTPNTRLFLIFRNNGLGETPCIIMTGNDHHTFSEWFAARFRNAVTISSSTRMQSEISFQTFKSRDQFLAEDATLLTQYTEYTNYIRNQENHRRGQASNSSSTSSSTNPATAHAAPQQTASNLDEEIDSYLQQLNNISYDYFGDFTSEVSQRIISIKNAAFSIRNTNDEKLKQDLIPQLKNLVTTFSDPNAGNIHKLHDDAQTILTDNYRSYRLKAVGAACIAIGTVFTFIGLFATFVSLGIIPTGIGTVPGFISLGIGTASVTVGVTLIITGTGFFASDRHKNKQKKHYTEDQLRIHGNAKSICEKSNFFPRARH